LATRDYSDDEDFYSQGFEKKGVLSVWIGVEDRSSDRQIDTLQDLCGVGYYELGDQESNSFDYELVDISRLLENISYASTFMDAVILAAQSRSIDKARRITIQFDFEYNPEIVTRSIATDPIFLGVFNYSMK